MRIVVVDTIIYSNRARARNFTRTKQMQTTERDEFYFGIFLHFASEWFAFFRARLFVSNVHAIKAIEPGLKLETCVCNWNRLLYVI